MTLRILKSARDILDSVTGLVPCGGREGREGGRAGRGGRREGGRDGRKGERGGREGGRKGERGGRDIVWDTARPDPYLPGEMLVVFIGPSSPLPLAVSPSSLLLPLLSTLHRLYATHGHEVIYDEVR